MKRKIDLKNTIRKCIIYVNSMSSGFLFQAPSNELPENFSFQTESLMNHILLLYKENVELRNQIKELHVKYGKIEKKLNKMETKIVLTEFEENYRNE